MNRASQGPAPAAVLEHMLARGPELVATLQQLTEAESPSDDPHAQGAVREVIARQLQALDYRVRRIPGRQSGGMLFARPAERARGGPLQLLLGHYDTVWPRGTLARMPFEVEGDTVRGPGVYDMKGGITQLLLALGALRHFDSTPEVTPLVFLNSDEEVGSRESTRYIARLARLADRSLVMEPSLGSSGRLKTTRKGIARFTVTVEGQAAHAGLDPGAGASAILELSHVIQSLFALNDAERGISVNVGTIDGGLRPNVVAPVSQAEVDVRVADRRDGEAVERAIRDLRPAIPGTRLRVTGGFGRPPMEATPANRRLWRLAARLGGELGLDLREGMAGGGSDGCTTSRYTATLDGLGAVGDGAHAPHEHLRVGHTLERAALLTLLLLAEPVGGGDKERLHAA